jgi:hypothetical protein
MDGKIKIKIENLLEHYSNIYITENSFVKLKKYGLLGGNIGIPIFLFEYSIYKNDYKLFDADGVIGNIYYFEYIKKKFGLQIFDTSQDLNFILNNYNLFNYYDFLNGGYLGIFHVMNEFKIKKNKKSYHNLFTNIFKEPGDYIKADNSNRIDFSISHGIISQILILDKTMEYLNLNGFENVFNKILTFFENNIDENQGLNVFPDFKIGNDNFYVNNKLSWCYGDISTSYSMYKLAVKYSKDYNFYLNNLIRLSHVRDVKMFDSSIICHGISGVILIFSKLFKETEIKCFESSVIFWTDLLIEKHLKRGFLNARFSKNDKKYYINDYSFLEGSSGILLVLLSLIKKESTDWDKIILL